jgi:hypothetical protein
MVLHDDGRKISIDTKGLKNKTNWPITVKLKRPDHFFILVAYVDQFESLEHFPEVFVIPSLEMRPPLLGNWSSRKQHKMSKTCVGYRRLRDFANGKYKDAWHLLFRRPSKRK